MRTAEALEDALLEYSGALFDGRRPTWTAAAAKIAQSATGKASSPVSESRSNSLAEGAVKEVEGVTGRILVLLC